MKYYVIYEIESSEDNEEKRAVCIRDTRRNAQIVLEALEKTNMDFVKYKIEISNRKVI